MLARIYFPTRPVYIDVCFYYDYRSRLNGTTALSSKFIAAREPMTTKLRRTLEMVGDPLLMDLTTIAVVVAKSG